MDRATETPAATLARWQAEDAAARARQAQPGAVPLDAVRDRPAIAMFEAMLRGELPSAPIGRTLDFVLVEIEPGRAVFQGRPGPQLYNPMGAVHGGWFATLLDSALGCCIHAALPAGKGYTTLELKVNMIRALNADVPLVRAEGKLVHLGRQTATSEARLYGPDGRLYGHGSTTALLFDLR